MDKKQQRTQFVKNLSKNIFHQQSNQSISVQSRQKSIFFKNDTKTNSRQKRTKISFSQKWLRIGYINFERKNKIVENQH